MRVHAAQQLHQAGQSLWLDTVGRYLLTRDEPPEPSGVLVLLLGSCYW